jgi:hypothetical protein
LQALLIDRNLETTPAVIYRLAQIEEARTKEALLQSRDEGKKPQASARNRAEIRFATEKRSP